MIRALFAVARRVMFGPVLVDGPDSLILARMYGELLPDFIRRGDSNNAYVLACRAFHHARTYLGR